MPLHNVNELQDMHLDVLKEIGNIGSGNAAGALSDFLQVPTDITVPSVKLLDFSETVNFLGGPENVAIGMLVNIKGDITGMMLYVLEKSFASKMTSALFGTEIEDIYNMNEMELSVIQEVGNIMAASYMNALASLTGMMIDISVPTLTVDMVGAILSVPAIQFGQYGNNALLIETEFGDDYMINGYFILMPEEDSYATILTSLGIQM